ncbi:ABC transporter permease subunit [Paenibacillus sp. FSL K6-3182]|uniref:ABC transporter permease n=1 Tax=Paenibacillus sp. FSL K6-3182 TaxID=2921495 RepID=UPI0030D005CC
MGNRSLYKRNYQLYLMIIPGIISAFIFYYLPMAGAIMAFQDFKPWLGFIESPWVGFKHFHTIFQYDESKQVIWNTLVIASLKIVFGLIVPVTFALLLNEVRNTKLKKTVQTLVYFPHFLSWVLLGGVLLDILSPNGGLLNRFIEGVFGIEPFFFLGDGTSFRITVIVSDVWKEFGFSTIVFLASLAGISPTLYEASVMDGANRWKQTVHVTIPGILPIIIVMGTLALGNVLNAGFDQIFNLYNPLVYDKGDIIDTYVYRMSIINGDYSFGTAVGLFKSIVAMILIIISYRLAYKFANYRIF